MKFNPGCMDGWSTQVMAFLILASVIFMVGAKVLRRPTK